MAKWVSFGGICRLLGGQPTVRAPLAAKFLIREFSLLVFL